MWLQMPNSCEGLTPHPAMLSIHLVLVSIIAPATSQPLHPFPRTQKIQKVPPQSLLTLRMVTPSKPIVASPKLLFNIFLFIILVCLVC